MVRNPGRHSLPSVDRSGGSQPDEPCDLSQDEIFHILQTNRRRDVIVYLLDKEDPIKMRDIAEIVAAKENETTVANLTSAQRQRVYIPLYQNHLPKLDEEGIIEYDKPRGIVRPTDRLEIFRPYLDAANPNDRSDRPDAEPDRFPNARAMDDAATDYYVAAVGVSAGLLTASASGLLPIPGLALATITNALFVLAIIAANRSVSLADGTEDEARPL
ncbi:hypothetical protein [Haloterrigena salinisoli]|uniref:DUF7344 domain-containing protein n=1 Tax=Haloterrigena salinisoli TaxID=3132747 RepID=UPI0030CC907A